MKFNLFLTNRHRARWLWCLPGLAAGLGLALVARQLQLALGVAVALLISLFTVLLLFNKLFRQLVWAQLDPEGITWLDSTTGQPESYPFASLRAYRFDPTGNGLHLRLYLHTGKIAHIEGRFDAEFAALWQSFDQAIRQYNRTWPTTAVLHEKNFFERAISTKVLLGLLVVSAGWVTWGIGQGLPPGAYWLVALVVLPYLAPWAACAGKRD